jgi:Helix-turn-helix domain
MTIQAFAWAFDQRLTGNAKLVLLALANHADHTTGHCDVDPATLAREASIRESSLWRYLGALERNGYLARDVKRTSEGERRDYWLRLDRDPLLPWAWDAQDDDKPDDAGAETPRPTITESPPTAFRRAEQDALRQEIVDKPDPNRPDGLVPVIEGSRAYKAWCDDFRSRRKIPPFVRTIVVGNREHRGFFMPTLFPVDTSLEEIK